MANIASSKKDARRSAEQAVRNRGIRSSVKTKVAKVRRAVVEGTADGVAELAMTAVSGLDRAVSKGALHRNNAARRKSRLMKRVQTVDTATTATAPPVKKAAPAAKKGSPAKAATKTPARKTKK